MADETQTDPAPADVVAQPPAVEPEPAPPVEAVNPFANEPPAPKPFKRTTTPSTAKERLRAFEDKHLGKDAIRIGGQIERGHGSAFKGLSPELHAEYAAIEKLIDAEQKVDDAKAGLEAAKADLAIAAKAADAPVKA